MHRLIIAGLIFLIGTSPATAAPENSVDPFQALRVVIPRDKLPPLTSVRLRGRRENLRKKEIRIVVRSIPDGARVTHGKKTLGQTPLTLTAPRNSTPLDIVIRRAGYMKVRTRIHRDKGRKYTFRLHPGRLH